MSYQPPFPAGGQPPRSTPIPGDGPFQTPIYDAPPTPSQFLGSTPIPTDLPTDQLAPPQFNRPVAPKRSRGCGGSILGLIIIGSIIVGVGVAVWGVMKANDAVDKATNTADEYSNPALSKHDREALGLSGNEQNLWDANALQAVVTTLDDGIAGTPTSFTEINVYTDYAYVVAQNPTKPDHLDRYGWRIGVISEPEAQQNDADAPTKAFRIDEMDWAKLADAVQQAPALLNVEEGVISFVSISRDVWTDGSPVVGRIYVSGPRSSGYVEIGPDGTVIAKF